VVATDAARGTARGAMGVRLKPMADRDVFASSRNSRIVPERDLMAI